MFLSAAQIAESVKRLEKTNPFFGITFLVFKKGNLPVGSTTTFPIDAKNKDFLERYYRPDERSQYFYRVFRPSEKKKDWNNPDYASTGLQSVNTRTFGSAFLHHSGSTIWGWKENYVDELEKRLGKGKRIPLLDLAIWLYRNQDWSVNTSPKDVIDRFKKEFNITEESLFSDSLPLQELDLQENRATWQDLCRLLNPTLPDDFKPEEGGVLEHLLIKGVGPAKKIQFEPATRLSVITGDNGLGKTFLLECTWWALTGNWADKAAYPRSDAKPNEPQISFLISGEQRPNPINIRYDWTTNSWPSPNKRPTIPGLIVYARVDGSFAVWDPMMNRHLIDPSQKNLASRYFVFTREEVWKGDEGKIIEGLLRDWVSWQVEPQKSPFWVFTKVLQRLSPPDIKLEPDEPRRLPDYSMRIPTLKHSYGSVPLVYESAGIRRIITLAYLIVWAWNEHKIRSELVHSDPQRNLVILIDEMEAHLHPKWQRSVLPALLDVSKELADDLQVQLMVATHSPLVTASIEPVFDEEKDKLFHLDLTTNGEARLEEKDFLIYGTFDSWLTSELFDLAQPKNMEAEKAINEAMSLQAQTHPDPQEIRNISDKLQRLLATEDRFWPQWLYFAEQHGVDL